MTKAQIREQVISMCSQLKPLADDVDMLPHELISYRRSLRRIAANEKAHTIETIGKLYLLFQSFNAEFQPYERGKKRASTDKEV